MKKLILLSVLLSLLMSCKDANKTNDYSKEDLNVTTSVYPENIAKVFNAHGGIDTWNTFESLVFEMEKEGMNEKTTTDLKNRHSIIDAETYSIGYDGKQVWLKEKDTATYKGNAKFYYNLMFYFYAMPFIVGDDGINYEKVEPLQFEDKTYPGIKITYESGIGESPEDEYIVYYDADTNKMAWLGYTVTYFSKEKSKEFHFIKYSEWQTVEGVLLPKTLTWYNYENNVPTTKRNDVNFVNVSLSKEKLNDNLFAKPNTAKAIE